VIICHIIHIYKKIYFYCLILKALVFQYLAINNHESINCSQIMIAGNTFSSYSLSII